MRRSATVALYVRIPEELDQRLRAAAKGASWRYGSRDDLQHFVIEAIEAKLLALDGK